MTTGSSTTSPSAASASWAAFRRSKAITAIPASICASVNDEVVHGIPGDYVLQDGDLLSIDIGTTLDGYVSDSAVTIPIGTISQRSAAAARRDARVPDARDRADAARQPRRRHRRGGAAACRERTATASCASWSATGSGTAMHEEPQVPNYGKPGPAWSCGRGWCWPSSR